MKVRKKIWNIFVVLNEKEKKKILCVILYCKNILQKIRLRIATAGQNHWEFISSRLGLKVIPKEVI